MKRGFQSRNNWQDIKKIKFDEFSNLPIYKYKKKLISDIKSRESFIVISTTGSGKTTQIPKLLYTDGINNGKTIGISQPRRIATISIATRVAEEMNCKIGETVGYSVRFEHVTSKNTKIKFMTDGILLREAVVDPLLKSYSIIILDEVHERSLNNDLLFGVVKSAQQIRRERNMMPLKVIIMSATIDPFPFNAFFGNEADTLNINSKANILKIKCATKMSDDYVRDSAAVCLQLHTGKIDTGVITDFSANKRHSILIFLTGEDEILKCCEILKEESKSLVKNKKNGLSVYPLYSALPSELQKLAVTESSGNSLRNIIVATNIAETSITIPGVRVVIDCGFSKQKFVHPETGLESLKVCPISKAQAEQRAGRASRLGPGMCFRLYTEYHYSQVMPDQTQPEIFRSNLSSISLTIFGLGFQDLLNFSWIDRPNENQLKRAITTLRDLAAIEEVPLDHKFKITELGRLLLRFPMDPRLAYALIESSKSNRNCLADVTAVVSMLTIAENLFQKDHNNNSTKDSVNVSEIFYSASGDLISLLKIYRAFTKLDSSQEKTNWCRTHCVKVAEMNRAVLINKQLKDICNSVELPMKTCREEFTNIVKCFVKPFEKQIARSLITKTVKKKNVFQSSSPYSVEYSNLAFGNKGFCIHPSSVLCRNRVAPEMVLYIECVETHKIHMRFVSVISPDWLD